MTDLPRLSDTLGAMLDEADPDAPGLVLDAIRLGLPLELSARRVDGRLELAGAPTDQHYRTSFMPVLHRLQLNVRFLETDDGHREVPDD